MKYQFVIESYDNAFFNDDLKGSRNRWDKNNPLRIVYLLCEC